MNIGIFEVINYNHFTLVECLIKIYSTDSDNNIFLCTSEKNISENKELLEPFTNLNLVPRLNDESLSHYFERMNEYDLDLAYLVTFENPVYFESLLNSKINYPINLFIHNIDFWFKVGYVELVKKFLKSLLNLQSFGGLINSIKFHFQHFKLNKKVIELVIQTKGRFAVLNQRMKVLASEFIDNQRIVVIPFSFFDKSIIETYRKDSKKLRITLPGYVTQMRRDYLGLLNAIRKNINDLKYIVEFDFLGGIQDGNDKSTAEILSLANDLIHDGMNIIIHNTSSIKVNDFDSELAKADLILANLTPKLGYGKNKESGIPFSMLKFAIPGLFQKGVYFMPELTSSILVFDDYDDLIKIIIELHNNEHKIRKLKNEALKNSENFKPESIYQRLLETNSFIE